MDRAALCQQAHDNLLGAGGRPKLHHHTHHQHFFTRQGAKGCSSRGLLNQRRQSRAVPAASGAESAPTPIEQAGNAFTAVKEIQEIMQILPHRFPFLLVDRVVEWEHQKSAVGYKNVTINDNFFPGHFPQRAIMPGVLQVEAMAQLGGIVMMDAENKAAQQNFFFGGIEKCRFRRPVVPGDTLMMRVDVTKYNKRYGIVKMDGKAYVGKELVCEAELTLAMGS